MISNVPSDILHGSSPVKRDERSRLGGMNDAARWTANVDVCLRRILISSSIINDLCDSCGKYYHKRNLL